MEGDRGETKEYINESRKQRKRNKRNRKKSKGEKNKTDTGIKQLHIKTR